MAIEITLSIITAIVIGLVQVAKTMGLPSRYAPLLAIILGVLGLLVITWFAPEAKVVFTGIVVGLTACGLYSGVKKTIKG